MNSFDEIDLFELFGSRQLRLTQKKIIDKHSELGLIPNSFSQGRTFGLVDVVPGRSNLSRGIVSSCDRLLVHCRLPDRVKVIETLRFLNFKCQDQLILMSGEKTKVLPACERIRSKYQSRMEAGEWTVITNESPRAQIREIQELHQRSGITPMPGWFLRGHIVPALTLAFRANCGRIVAAGTIQLVQGEQVVNLVAGICVDHSWRNKGLGQLLNSELLIRGFDCFNSDISWSILDQVTSMDPPHKICLNCGFLSDSEYCFIFAQKY